MRTSLLSSSTCTGQGGVYMPWFAIAALALFGMLALAIDGGWLLLNKARLQNAVDAAALAGAIAYDQSGSTTAAATAAHETFALNAQGPGNQPLALALAEQRLPLEVSFSSSLSPESFTSGGLGPFVRASVPRVAVFSWFARVLGFEVLQVAASAVAGPSPELVEVCDILPVVACGNPALEAEGLFGYEANDVVELKTSTGSDPEVEVGPGNFQLIRLEGASGAADVRDAMAGLYENCLDLSDADTAIDTEPGNSVGPVVQGIDMRFEPCGPPVDCDLDDDGVVDILPDEFYYSSQASVGDVKAESADDYRYADYLACQSGAVRADSTFCASQEGEPDRRIVVVPIGDCSGSVNGAGSLPILGLACFFLLEPVRHQGNEASLIGEFIGDCLSKGTPGLGGGAGHGLHRIQLYKDATVHDA